MNNFYNKIEPTVRPFVKSLREHGINTIASCEHDGYILAESRDPTTEQQRISIALTIDMEVKKWKAVLTIECDETGYYEQWEITSPVFHKIDD